ncbi:MAG: metallophosphoesterase [Chloroflexota bacterium]|nr:MAG: metallophosphoesterase [Chloroflexota bacterium]
MRILVISDIHANSTALDAVLANAGEIDAVWCLGDIVGYGPDPNECVSRVRTLPNLVCLLGNHDAAALKQIDTDSFNPDARTAIHWTRHALTPESISFLESLPEMAVIDHVTLAHGSPRQPVWEYLLDTRTATQNFESFDTPYCFVGHTHLPVLYYLPDESRVAQLIVPDAAMQITLAPRAILNPGSVGQPRDRDPRAAYAIFQPDQNIFEYRRISYNIAAVQSRMELADLPERHIQRLSAGW